MNLNINSFIKKQPAPNYHLRYIDEPRGVLTGYRTSQEKLNKIINYPQVNILLPLGSAKREFYILVSLHNSDNKCLSPHLLLRRGEKKPNYRFIFEQIPKISSLEYSWELRDYVMVRSKQGHYKDTFVEKQKEYGELQLPLAFDTLRGDVDIENEQSLKQSGDLIVSLGFTIFEKIIHNGAKTFRLCPSTLFCPPTLFCPRTLFSNPIYNGDDLNIQKICNLNGYKNESTEVTLLVVFNSNYDINVVIKRIDEIEWTKVIKIGKNEKFHNAAITFQAPPYDGPSCSDDQITTAIHVEVENTLYRSNEVKFCYRNNVTEEPKRKRTCNENGENVAANVNANESSSSPPDLQNAVATISTGNGALNSTINNAQINLVLDNNLDQNGGHVRANMNANEISCAPLVSLNNSCFSVATISAENGPLNLPTNEAQINHTFHNNLNENFINDNFIDDNFINDNSTANNAQINLVLDNNLNQNGGNVAENINGNQISFAPPGFPNNSCSSVATISAENGPRNLPTNEAQINYVFHNNLNENFINDNFINDNSTANNAQINLVLDNSLNQNGGNVAENINGNEISCDPQVFLNNSCSSVATISTENGPRNLPTNEAQINHTFHNNLNENFINENYNNDNFINDNSTINNEQINLVLDNNLNQNGGNVAENIHGNEISCDPQVLLNNSCSSVATISAENGPRNSPTNEAQINHTFHNNFNENFINDNFIDDNFIDDNFINDNFRWSPDKNFENSEFNIIEFFERCQDVVPQELIYDDGKIPNENISRDSATTDIDENVLNEKVSNLSGQTSMEQNSTSLQKPNIGEKIIVVKETSQEMPTRNIISQIMIKHKKSIKIMDINNKDLNLLFYQALLNVQNLHRFYKGFQDIRYKPLVRQARNAERENLLHYACKYNKAFGIRPLIGLDCRINEQDIYGRTPLHIALDCRHYECVFKIQQLLENHTKYPKEVKENFIKMFKVYNRSGYTVLHVAILRNHLKLVEIMLKFCREYEINIFDYEVLGTGDSVVHLIVQHDLIDMAKILRRYLSSKDYGTITNYLGQTAMELPKISNEMESLLLEKL